ncbi:MAG: hypothetical protein AAFW68_10300, partial [Pseudomonadota bacterium]
LVAASPAIKGVHNIQISQITPEQPRLTLHACISDPREAASALATAKAYLDKNYGIQNSTIQIEIGDECPDADIANTSEPVFEVHENKNPSAPIKTQGRGAAALAASD